MNIFIEQLVIFFQRLCRVDACAVVEPLIAFDAVAEETRCLRIFVKPLRFFFQTSVSF